MNPRKSSASVTYNGKNIDAKLADYLNTFSYTDISSGQSDSISILVNDRDERWMRSWFPSKGDTMNARIIMENWNREGDTRNINCGSYVLDDFSYSGEPVKLKMDALAIPTNTGFKTTDRTKTYEKTTIENIAGEIARRAGIRLYYEAKRISIEKAEQSEKDDCSFLNEIVKLYGLAMKIFMNKIVIFSEATYENRSSVTTIMRTDVEPNWNWNTKLNDIYTKVVYEYTNNDKNQTFRVTAGSGNRTLKASDAAGTLSEATTIALAKINEANKNETTITLTLTLANPRIIATSCVNISGFGRLDGKYYVDKVSWDVGSGCKQKLCLRRVRARITSASASSSAVAKASGTETRTTAVTMDMSMGGVMGAAAEIEEEEPAEELVKGGAYTLTETKKGYYTAAEALADSAVGGNPTGVRRPGIYTIFNISQGMLNLTTRAGTPGSWINPD